MRRIPLVILALFACDLFLVIAPVIDHSVDSPIARLRTFIHLDAENTLQAWYSSMQWLAAGILFGLMFIHAYRSQLPGALAIGLLAAACVAFSVDEIAGIHEWIGQRSDALLPGGDRANTPLFRTGIWPILLGIPVLATLFVIVVRARRIFLPRSPKALSMLTAGLIIMFTGALAVELAVNLIGSRTADPDLALVQLVCEEFLEMLGVSIVVWSGLELLRTYGFELRIPVAMRLADSRPTALSPRPSGT
jgi:hypothetical protein